MSLNGQLISTEAEELAQRIRGGDATDILPRDIVLAGWLHYDVLAVAGPKFQQRRELFDFVLAELVARQAEVAEPPAPTGPHSAWDPFFALFWTPFR